MISIVSPHKKICICKCFISKVHSTIKYRYYLFKMSGKDLDYIMNFEKIKFWTVSSLKLFLRLRNMSGIGNKEMLVARSLSTVGALLGFATQSRS